MTITVEQAARSALVRAACLARLAPAAVTFAIGLYVSISTIVMVIRTWSPLPYLDQWDELQFGRDLSLGWLFSPFNEHRIVVSRLIFYIDQHLFAASNKFDFFLISVIPGLIALFAAHLVMRGRSRSVPDRAWVAGISLSLLYWSTQYDSFTWAFEVQYFCVNLAAIGAFTLASAQPTIRNLVMTVIFASIAVYSSANGLIVPLLAVFVAIWMRWPWRYNLVLAIAAVVLWGTYFIDFHLPDNPMLSPTALLELPNITKYVLIELGAPFGLATHSRFGWDPIATSAIVGTLGIMTFALIGARLLVSRATNRAGDAALFALAGFILCSTLMVSLSRGHLDNLIEWATTSRYTTFTVVFWLALVLLMFCRAANAAARGPQLLMVCALPVVVFIGFAQGDQVPVRQPWQVWEVRTKVAPGLLADVRDVDIYKGMSNGVDITWQRRKILKAARASIFADGWSTWLGTPLTDHVGLTDPGRCRGAFASAIYIADAEKPGWRAIGWAADRRRKRGLDKIVFADAQGVVAGYGIGGFHLAAPVKRAGWVGAVRARDIGDVRALALVDDERAACPLGAAARLWADPIHRGLDRLAEPIAEVTASFSGNWCRDGTGSERPFPFAAPVYGSYCVGRGDSGTGTLSLANLPDTTGAVGLPVLLGANPGGLSLSLTDRRSGKAVRSVLLETVFGESETWYTFQITPPAGTSLADYTIEARDDGTGWGQWFAASSPFRLR